MKLAKETLFKDYCVKALYNLFDYRFDKERQCNGYLQLRADLLDKTITHENVKLWYLHNNLRWHVKEHWNFLKILAGVDAWHNDF